jgi:hypothetical protein
MRHFASLLFGILIVALGADVVTAASVYRWRDASGGLHFSNRSDAVPQSAATIELAPLSVLPVPVRARAGMITPVMAPGAPIRLATPCDVGDPEPLASVVGAHLDAKQHEDLTVVVAGMPIAHGRDAVVTLKGPDPIADPAAPVDQGAIAYPAGAPCPALPPLTRYAIASGRRAPSRGACDDFQRAFAEVGVAVSRDEGVARSFRAVAEHFVAVAANGYGAGQGAGRVEIAPWIVDAHVAQTHELGEEAGEFVDELTVALEEIDGAARARGCW